MGATHPKSLVFGRPDKPKNSFGRLDAPLMNFFGWIGSTNCQTDLPPASAGSDMIRWSRVLLSPTLDAARPY